jgi:hypothetical protein
MIDPDNYYVQTNYGSGLYNTGKRISGSGTTIIQSNYQKDHELLNYDRNPYYYFAGSNYKGGLSKSFKLKIELINF